MKVKINGSHFSEDPDYFEWWYFHFITENGQHFNIVLHETDIFGIEKRPYISISLYKNGEKERHFYGVLTEGDIVRRTKYLVIKSGTIVEESGVLSMSLCFKNDIHFDGIIHKLSCPLIINNGLLACDQSGRKSYWVAHIPHGSFEGFLSEGKTKRRFKGMAYQDHQWGNLKIQDYVSDWTWGHFSNNNLSTVFFHIKTQNNETIDRSAIINKNGILINNKLYVSGITNYSSSNKAQSERKNMDIIFSEQNAKLSFSINNKQLIRSRINEQLPGFESTYLRWWSQSEFLWRNDSVKLDGITEYLRIRR